MTMHPTIGGGLGRPREFEMDEAVQDAKEVFWSRGYNATSIIELIEGTGLSRGSLYKAFKDKKSLYLAAIDQYTSSGLKRLGATLNKEGSAKSAIREALMYYARVSSNLAGRKGCFVTAATLEMLPHDAEVETRVTRMFKQMQELFEGAITRGQIQGEIPPMYVGSALARFLLCNIEGMRVLGKSGRTHAEMTEVVNVALTVLE